MKKRSTALLFFAGTSLSETLDTSLATPEGVLHPAFAGDAFLAQNIDQQGEWKVVEVRKYTWGKWLVICTVSSDN